MIIDTLDNLEKYISLNPLFEDVVSFIKENNLTDLPEGKTYIKGNDLFVNVQSINGKTKDEAVLETHIKMIDIQIPLTGEETFGYTPVCNLPSLPYNEEKDITKFGNLKSESYVTCGNGMFAIFFPQDGHAPCIASAPLKKAIFKIKA